MIERPILFSGEMVRAILAGRKTQTRRVVSPQPAVEQFVWRCRNSRSGWALWEGRTCTCKPVRNQYGAPGDRLWVRETWAPYGGTDDDPIEKRPIFYRADNDTDEGWATPPDLKWRPSIFMPRSACRLELEVTDIRVDRLNEISDRDCRREGTAQWAKANPYYRNGRRVQWPSIRHAYAALWDTINVTRAPWRFNPMVWVVDFRRAS